MCGIAGIVHADRRPVDVEALRRMTRTLAHRGPDGHGAWADGATGLAHTRLAIIDLQGGRQPMVSPETGCVLTYNGEIYNYRQLRGELAGDGATFDDESDTQVVLRAYERWGEACVDRLTGMFAFADVGPAPRRLFRARPPRHQAVVLPVGRHDAGFASELTGVLAADPCAPRALDTRSFDAYLRLQSVPGPTRWCQASGSSSPAAR